MQLNHPPVAWAAVLFKVVVLLLLQFCFMYLQLFAVVLCLVFVVFFLVSILCVTSVFAIILTKNRQLVALL